MNRLVVAAFAVSAAACSIDTQQGEVGVYQAPAAAVADPGPDTPAFFLTMYLRDFKIYNAADPSTNPAFDNGNSERSVVATALGPDRKPVYQAPTNTVPTFGAALFAQWYRDVPGTNITVVYPLPISPVNDGTYEYDSELSGKPDTYQGVSRRVFFPLDDGDPYATQFGNQGESHNYAFTGELHATFVAKAGASLEVRADDDLYVFIDGKLAIDLGGTHSALAQNLALDDLALAPGQTYPLDVFYAERQGATGVLKLKTDLQLSSVID